MVADVYPNRDSEYRPKCPECGAYCVVKKRNKTPSAGKEELVACRNCGLGIEGDSS